MHIFTVEPQFNKLLYNKVLGGNEQLFWLIIANIFFQSLDPSLYQGSSSFEAKTPNQTTTTPATGECFQRFFEFFQT